MAERSFTVILTDGENREEYSCIFPIHEWETLLSFHENVEGLRSTRFVQNERGGQISVHWERGQPVRTVPHEVDNDEVWSMLLKLRPFVLEKEVYYFHRIKNTLKRRLGHPAFRSHVDQLHKGFTLGYLQEKLKLRGAGRPLMSVDVVMDWLNSFEYHRDPKKRRTVEMELGFLGKDKNGLSTILFALVEMINAVLAMGDLVETLVKAADGECPEIKCEPGLLPQA